MELPVQFRSVRLLTGPRRLRPRSHSMITSKPYRAQRWAFRMGRQHNVVRTFLLLVFDLGQYLGICEPRGDGSATIPFSVR